MKGELEIQPGERWGIVGRNGSGKSFLAAELAERYGGALVSFEVEDAILERELREDDSEFLGGVDFGRTVRELIEEDLSDGEEPLELAEKLGLGGLLEQGFLTLSTGEKRRLMLARALGESTDLIVLDEPFDGLDQAFRQPLRDLLAGRDLVMVANRLSDLEGVVSHVALVEGGRCLLAGEMEEMMAKETFRQFTHLGAEVVKLPEGRGVEAPPGPLVVMKEVTVVHGGREIISSFNWVVERGENWKISGPNGCGKSTLVNLVTGDHTQCYSNEVTVMGMRRGSGESVWDVKRFIGIVSPGLHQQYRVGANALTVVASGFVDSVGIYQDVAPEQVKEARRWLSLVGMGEWVNRPFRGFSYGQQRLLLIARALVKRPPLLILDEPCQGLDEMNRALVLGVIDRIVAMGLTQILYITHEPEDRLECVTHELRHDGEGWKEFEREATSAR